MKYKFLRLVRGKIKSDGGNEIWEVGEWKKTAGTPKLCKLGFHCFKTPYQAFSYVQGEVLAIVEVKGKKDIQDEKEVWEQMRIVKAYKWTKKDSVAFAIYAAELVIDNYEKKYPNDKRPRKAIEAAKKVLFKDTAKNRSAAWSAARPAWSATLSAARSASWVGAWVAESASRSAAWVAESAASLAASPAAWYAAESARFAARSAVYEKLNKFMVKRIKTLEEL